MALLAGVGALITFAALWPLWGALIALAIAPFGGSLLAILVIALATAWARLGRKLDGFQHEESSSGHRPAAPKLRR
jgi:hypothetical protein